MRTVKIIDFEDLLQHEDFKDYLLTWVVGAEGNFIEYTIDDIVENKIDVLLKQKYGCKIGEFLFIAI